MLMSSIRGIHPVLPVKTGLYRPRPPPQGRCLVALEAPSTTDHATICTPTPLFTRLGEQGRPRIPYYQALCLSGYTPITARQRRCPSPSPPQQGWCFVGLGGALTSAYAPGCPPPNASNYITDHPVPLAYTLGPSPIIPFICGLRTRFSRNTVKSSGPARALLFKWVEAEIWRYGCRSTAATRALGCPQRSIFNSCATDLRRAAVIWRG